MPKLEIMNEVSLKRLQPHNRLNLPNFLYVAADLMYIIKFDDLHFDPMLGAILN